MYNITEQFISYIINEHKNKVQIEPVVFLKQKSGGDVLIDLT